MMRLRSSLKSVRAALTVLLLAATLASADGALSKPFLVYFGTYTGTKSQGIYVSRFDPASGKLSAPALAAPAVNPAYLALAPDRQFLFAVNETDRFNGQPGGAVSAFKLDAATGKLEFLDQQPSGGTSPCHLAVDADGRFLAVANYNSGSVAVFPVQTNGFISPPTAVIQHHGSSINRVRQAGPHAHCIAMDSAHHRVFVCDLGLDKVMICRLNETNGTLTPGETPWAELKPGSGPRHITFSADGRHAYVISEMASTLTTFAYDPEHGTLKAEQTVSLLPPDFQGKNTAAEVAIHPSGKFVYGSNRGDDSIAVFAVDESSGRLNFVERQSTRGKIPRCFAIDPTGQYLIVANQNSDNIVVFRIDTQTGRLTWTGQTVEVGRPVCVTFVPLASTAP
ncbi:MAG TPA: lactonase family protein [Verrucomicrobiae bacterium]|nr:lactonase family protein [Verrucomicrobiae bacterium]